MKKVFFIIGLLVIADLFYFSYVNSSTLLNLNYKPIIDVFEMNSGIFYLSLGLYGALGGFFLTYSKVIELNEKIKKQKNNVEKASISSEENSDKVKLLQSKIDSLEIALKQALKDR